MNINNEVKIKIVGEVEVINRNFINKERNLYFKEEELNFFIYDLTIENQQKPFLESFFIPEKTFLEIYLKDKLFFSIKIGDIIKVSQENSNSLLVETKGFYDMPSSNFITTKDTYNGILYEKEFELGEGIDLSSIKEDIISYCTYAPLSKKETPYQITIPGLMEDTEEILINIDTIKDSLNQLEKIKELYKITRTSIFGKDEYTIYDSETKEYNDNLISLINKDIELKVFLFDFELKDSVLRMLGMDSVALDLNEKRLKIFLNRLFGSKTLSIIENSFNEEIENIYIIINNNEDSTISLADFINSEDSLEEEINILTFNIVLKKISTISHIDLVSISNLFSFFKAKAETDYDLEQE